MPVLAPAKTLPALSSSDRTQVLDLLFEPSTALHVLVEPLLHIESFDTYPSLIAAIRLALVNLSVSPVVRDAELLTSILNAHPRLGHTKIDSAQSVAEQASLGGAHTTATLADLNRRYEDKFLGLRFVCFVNGRHRDVIKAEMEARIAEGSIESETQMAITAMCDIALDRARKLEGKNTLA